VSKATLGPVVTPMQCYRKMHILTICLRRICQVVLTKREGGHFIDGESQVPQSPSLQAVVRTPKYHLPRHSTITLQIHSSFYLSSSQPHSHSLHFLTRRSTPLLSTSSPEIPDHTVMKIVRPLRKPKLHPRLRFVGGIDNPFKDVPELDSDP
jgi:hypothetical protein